jgi:uncharacterized protein (TIGR03067 family)
VAGNPDRGFVRAGFVGTFPLEKITVAVIFSSLGRVSLVLSLTPLEEKKAMIKLIVLFSLTIILFQAVEVRGGDEAKDDLKNLAGAWTCVSAVNNGKPLGEDVVKQLRLTLTDKRYKTEKGRQVLFDGIYKVDPGQRPKHIDITAPEGEQGGKTSKGIYALEGDTLKMCYADKDRPTDFDSNPGSAATLVVWKRIK